MIMACRDLDSAKACEIEFRKHTSTGDLLLQKLDLASFASIRNFAEEMNASHENIDVLINNAGIFQSPLMHTEDGMEMQMGVNYLGHFLLTNLLLEKMKNSAPSRIVFVSSSLHKYAKLDLSNFNSENGYSKKLAYSNSKLAMNLFSRELATRIKETGVSVHCMHPGIVWTNLGRYRPIPLLLKPILLPLAKLILQSPWQGCQTILYCACAEELEGETGKYYGKCKEQPWSKISLDDHLAKQLWDHSVKLTNL